MKIVIAGLIGLMLGVGARAESEVSGQVRFAGGEPVGGADVVLFDVSDERLGVVAKTTTDEAGQFALALTAAGSVQPVRFNLGQSYPNPFNPSTIIPYELAEAARVRLDVFNVVGQRVTTLVDDEQAAGSYTAQWDARDASGQGVASGVYLYRLMAASTSSADEAMATRRMVLVDGSAGAVLPGGAVGGGGSVAEAVDMVEAVEAPVYGLAVEVEGLKTYVDSAFVVGAEPVEVVLDGGRAKLAAGAGLLTIPPITLTVGSSYHYKIESENIYSGEAYGAKSSNSETVDASGKPIYKYGTSHSTPPIRGGTVNIKGVAPGTATVTIRSPFGDAQTITVTVEPRPVSITSMELEESGEDKVNVDVGGKKETFTFTWAEYKYNNDKESYFISKLPMRAYIIISGLLEEAGIVLEESKAELASMIGGSLVEEGTIKFVGNKIPYLSQIITVSFGKAGRRSCSTGCRYFRCDFCRWRNEVQKQRYLENWHGTGRSFQATNMCRFS